METTYEEFIQNVLATRGRFACGDEYHEKHHIKPKCMGGTNDKDNLIDLFAREHFEAHRLLALENPDNDKLIHAWTLMSRLNNHSGIYELTSEEYEEARIAFSKSISGENNPMYGRTWWSENTPQEKIDEWKQHLSEVNSGENHPWFGKHHSEETKEKLRISHLKENLSPETLEKMKQSHSDMYGENNPMFGKCHSEESKEIMRQKRIQWMMENQHPFQGKHHSEETKKKISESKKGKCCGESHPNSIKIIRLLDEKIYDSIIDTAKDNKMSKNTVTKYCKIHKDFMYYDEWLIEQNDLENNKK